MAQDAQIAAGLRHSVVRSLSFSERRSSHQTTMDCIEEVDVASGLETETSAIVLDNINGRKAAVLVNLRK